MPTPVAHAFIGLSFGLGRYLPQISSVRQLVQAIWEKRWVLLMCILLANAPDIDYAFGIPGGNWNAYHQTATHTVIWCVWVAVIVWMLAWVYRRERARTTFVFVLVLLLSHVLADYFCLSKRGQMLFWPLSTACYNSGYEFFPSAMKNDWADVWHWHNVTVVIQEAAMTFPLVLIVLVWKWRMGRKTSGE